MSGRLGALVLLAVMAVAAATLAQGPIAPASENSFNGANCYGCHAQWSPVPMKSMFEIASPPQQIEGGSAGDYTVQVDEAWLAKPPWPKLTHFEAFVDLGTAPSLGFASQQPPVLGVQSVGTIPVASGPLEADEAEAFVTIEIPTGTSDLVLTLASNSTDTTAGPDLILELFPGRTSPNSTPVRSIDEGLRGVAERFVMHGGRNITAMSPDRATWAVQARLKPTVTEPRDVQLEQRPIPFTLTLDAYRNLTGESRQFLVVDRLVEAGGKAILPFRLVAQGIPAPGERFAVTVNATAHYPHDTGGGRDDWGNISKSTVVDVLAGADGAITLGQAAPASVGTAPATALPLDRLSEAVGYAAAFLIISSIASGGMLGKASRRGLNHLFGSAKRRVAFHNSLSDLIIVAAVAHTVLFIVETNYIWTLGVLWGGLSILAMAGLGVTGAWQVSCIRAWGYDGWRWTHYGLAVATIVFTLVHMGLDGANFGFVQEAVGWDDPFPDPRTAS